MRVDRQTSRHTQSEMGDHPRRETTSTRSSPPTARPSCWRWPKGGTETGTPIVLETESGKPWQEWSLKKNENGSYCLIPQHAPEKGLDHLGGKPDPGAKIDLWTNSPGDPHLQWIIKPLAGTLGRGRQRRRRDAAQFLRSARNQAGRDSQRRTQEFHVLRAARFFRAPFGK